MPAQCSSGPSSFTNSALPDYGSLKVEVPVPLQEIQHERVVDGRASSAATVFNMLNMYVGLGLLAQAYALQRGGWVTLLLMGLCCMFSAYTGKLLVRCFNKQQADAAVKGDASWVGLAEFVWNKHVKWVIFGLALTEICGAGCMAVLMLWRNLQGMFPAVDPRQLQLMSILCIVPALFANGFENLAFVSVLGVLSKALTTCLPIVVYLTLSWHSPFEHTTHALFHPTTLPMALAIIMLSYSAHVALPPLYMSMRRPQDFEAVTNCAFGMMFLQYSLMGIFGYLVWGDFCSPLITYDANLSISRPWQGVFTHAVSMLVAWSTYATIIPIITVISETMFSILDSPPKAAATTATKLALLFSVSALCQLLTGYLGHVEVALGIMSIVVSLMTPLAMHLTLFGPEMTPLQRLRSGLLLLCSLGCAILVAVCGVRDLMEHWGQAEPDSQIPHLHMHR